LPLVINRRIGVALIPAPLAAGQIDVTHLSESPTLTFAPSRGHRVLQVIADLFQRKALAEQVRGIGVTEPLWAVSLECLAEALVGNAPCVERQPPDRGR